MSKLTELLGALTEPALKVIDRLGVTPFLCAYGIFEMVDLTVQGKIPGEWGVCGIVATLVGFFFARYFERSQKANGGPAAQPPTI